MNEIPKRKPVQDAPADEEYLALHNQLSASNWRVIVDWFEKIGGQVYGRARVVAADSEEYRWIMGKDQSEKCQVMSASKISHTCETQLCEIMVQYAPTGRCGL